MKRASLCLAILSVIVLLSAETAAAQTIIALDIHKARLVWDWVKGAPPEDGDASGFHVKCGPASGTYSKTTDVTMPAKEIMVEQAITGPGTWYCTVSAFNEFAESANANEVGFRAGSAPSAPSSLTIQAK